MNTTDSPEPLPPPPPASGASREAIAVTATDPLAFECDDLDDALDEVQAPFDTMILTLTICGDELDPDDVTRRMGCPPTAARRRTEPSPAALADASSSSTGAWRLEVQGDAFTRASDLFEQLLGRFPAEPAFWQPLHRDFALQLHLSIHDAAPDCGFILSTEALARCAATGASLLTTFHLGGGTAPREQ